MNPATGYSKVQCRNGRVRTILLPVKKRARTVEEARENVLSWYFGSPPEPVRSITAFVEMVDELIEAVRREKA